MRARSGVSRDAIAIAVGLFVNGLTAYAFLTLPVRVGDLDASRFATLSAVWFVLFAAGPAGFFPIEQELSRGLSARLALEGSAGPVIRRALRVTVGVAGVVVVIVAIAGPFLLENLLNESIALLLTVIGGVLALGFAHLVKGSLSGQLRFAHYGWFLGVDGATRLVGCGICLAAGVSTAAPYALVLVIAPTVAIVLLARPAGLQRGLHHGTPLPIRPFVSAYGQLFGAQVTAQLLMNLPPLLAIVMSGDNREAAGRFAGAFVVARIPSFLFQAVLTVLLPQLSALAATDNPAAMTRAVKRMLILLAVATLAVLVFAAAAGPAALELFFGSDFVVQRWQLVSLAVASMVLLPAMTLAQALIAIRAYVLTGAAWLVGLVAFSVALIPSGEAIDRVTVAFLIGASITALVHFMLFQRQMASMVKSSVGPLDREGMP
jgi:O-antigen/teichoic acid export membrane protein